MTGRIQHRRSYDPTATFPPLQPGELAVNTANRQIMLGDSPTGTPLPLLAVRMFAATAKYAAGDLAAENGVFYRANGVILPGPFNASQWTLVSADVSVLVQKAGDTMQGPLLLVNATPSAPTEAAAKAYVDARDNSVTAAFTAADTNKVNKAGDTMTGILTLAQDPVGSLDAATKQYVLANAVIGPPSLPEAPDAAHTYGRIGGATKAWSPVLPIAGGTVTGPIVLPADPTTGLSAATKQYVDAAIAAIPPPPPAVPTGTPLPWLTDTAPPGYLFANGQAVSRTAFAALFAVFGTTFGLGDGVATFNLPDLREVAFIGKSTMGGTAARGLISQYVTTAIGALVGEANHSLTQAEMAQHSHQVYLKDPGHSHQYEAVGANQTFVTGGGMTAFINEALTNTSSAVTNITIGSSPTTANDNRTTSAGSGAMHNNVQPSFVGNWIIKT